VTEPTTLLDHSPAPTIDWPSAPTDPSPQPKRWMVVGGAVAVATAVAGFAMGRVTAPSTSTAAKTSVASAAPAGSVQDVLNQAIAAQQAGNFDAAVKGYQAVLAKDANNIYALFDLGVVAQSRNQPDEAVKWYQAALAVDANYGPALDNAGIVYAKQSDMANAQAMFERALKVNAKDASAMFNLGKVLVTSGKKDEGAKLIADAIVLDPRLKPAS
jgi:tetratricopeptide (TPR) repeat protein